MVHSKLPILPLLCLLWALPEPGVLSRVPLTDPGMQKALAFAVEQYNEKEKKSSNYFKYVHIQEETTEAVSVNYYYLRVGLVVTACQKKIGQAVTYGEIQQCMEILGNRTKKFCYFQVMEWLASNKMKLAEEHCQKA